MLNLSRSIFISIVFCLGATGAAAQQTEPTPPPAQSADSPAALAVDEWRDDFDGKSLDESRWERFTFEGGSGGKLEVNNGQLHLRGMGGSRSGVRSKQTFQGDRFIVEATIAKVGVGLPDVGQSSAPPGNAILTIMFDGSGRNRIEWLLTSEGRFEAWSVVDGRGERLDNRNLGTKIENPILSIARRGDDYFFALNGQVGLEKSIKNMPRAFRIMLYGYGSSENDWDSVKVVVPKKR